jgi:prepilin-type N-terminal cleavage/methylation domain-containing protein/prepilin-type processing-associated H-X9-DG protein
MQCNRKAAFTLIELLVVIAVIAILAALLFPVFARVREKARQATCLSDEHQIAMGTLMYIQDWDETLPFVLDWAANFNMSAGANSGDNGVQPVVRGTTGQEPRFQLVTVVMPYVKNAGVWYCPTVGPDYTWQAVVEFKGWKKGATMRDQGTSYAYDYIAFPYPATEAYAWSNAKFLGGKSFPAIVQQPSRWPMFFDEPYGCGFRGNIADPPASAMPHSGGLNAAYGDGHTKYYRMESSTVENTCYVTAHAGDGIFPDQ